MNLPSRLIDLVRAHPDKPWDWNKLSGVTQVDVQDVVAHASQPWNWAWLSQNNFKWNAPPSKTAIKARQDIIKEELIEAAWHPERVFDWCFDLEEQREIAAGLG